MDLTIFLKNLPAFEDFSPPQLQAFAALLTVQEHAAGHVFIRQGEHGQALYFLLRGMVRITRHDPDGVEYELREVCDGELFGILSLVDDLPASATCTAVVPGQTASLSREAFAQVFNEVSPIGRHLQYMIAVQMARDLQEANRDLRKSIS
mgnify:CR=1 FL=1